MPGKPVNDLQVRLYMQDRMLHSQQAAAARAGFSERTARQIDADPRPPSHNLDRQETRPIRGGWLGPGAKRASRNQLKIRLAFNSYRQATDASGTIV